MQTLINKLETQISDKTRELEELNAQLNIEKAKPENNVYESLKDAENTLYVLLKQRAGEDCEGSYNWGLDQYRQEFMVDGKVYTAVANVEYNRHDKTYYYVDGFDFAIEDA